MTRSCAARLVSAVGRDQVLEILDADEFYLSINGLRLVGNILLFPSQWVIFIVDLRYGNSFFLIDGRRHFLLKYAKNVKESMENPFVKLSEV